MLMFACGRRSIGASLIDECQFRALSNCSTGSQHTKISFVPIHAHKSHRTNRKIATHNRLTILFVNESRRKVVS